MRTRFWVPKGYWQIKQPFGPAHRSRGVAETSGAMLPRIVPQASHCRLANPAIPRDTNHRWKSSRLAAWPATAFAREAKRESHSQLENCTTHARYAWLNCSSIQPAMGSVLHACIASPHHHPPGQVALEPAAHVAPLRRSCLSGPAGWCRRAVCEAWAGGTALGVGCRFLARLARLTLLCRLLIIISFHMACTGGSRFNRA